MGETVEEGELIGEGEGELIGEGEGELIGEGDNTGTGEGDTAAGVEVGVGVGVGLTNPQGREVSRHLFHQACYKCVGNLAAPMFRLRFCFLRRSGNKR